jgi:hypothetical protein
MKNANEKDIICFSFLTTWKEILRIEIENKSRWEKVLRGRK